MASHASNISRINRILCIYTLLKQFQLSKLIEVEKYQHQQTTLLQLGAHLWPCILQILVQLSSSSIFLNLIWLHMDPNIPGINRILCIYTLFNLIWFHMY